MVQKMSERRNSKKYNLQSTCQKTTLTLYKILRVYARGENMYVKKEKRTENNFDQFQIIYLCCKIIVYSLTTLFFIPAIRQR